MQVAADRVHSGFQRLRGLVAGRRAEVQEALPGLRESSSGTMDCEPISCMRSPAAGCARILRLRKAARAIAAAVSAPYFRSHRASSHSGQESSTSREGHATGSRFTWRSIALTNPAADVFCARFTSSTALRTAACAGIRSR